MIVSKLKNFCDGFVISLRDDSSPRLIIQLPKGTEWPIVPIVRPEFMDVEWRHITRGAGIQMLSNIKINEQRLWDSLMEMAKIGGTPKGGCNRQALTDLDREGRDLFISWCKDAGCTVSVDTMGNIFARREGKNSALDPVVCGSHLDTQPTGGKFDGVFGVLAGLEIIRTLNDHNYESDAPIEIAMWTNEEGARFAPAMVASGVFAGLFTEEYGHSRADLDGKTIGGELTRIGYRGETPCGGRPFKAFFEAHIEQGPILEAENKTIGVVTGIQGIRWFECTVNGQDSHAGTTPMSMRRDALLGVSQIIQDINLIAHSSPASRGCNGGDWSRSAPIRATSFPARCSFRSICATPTMRCFPP